MEKICIPRGDAFNLPLTFTDETDTDNPVPFSLVGYTVFFTVKYKWDTSNNDDAALISKKTSSHDDAVNGETSFDLSETDTNLKTGEYKADIQIVKAGIIESSDQFIVQIDEDVTKITS